MDQYVGLDVSLKQTWNFGAAKPQADLARQVLVASAGGGRIDPPARAECGACGVRDRVTLDLVSPRVDGLPAVCIDARHAKAALDTAPNNANDACRCSPRPDSSGR